MDIYTNTTDQSTLHHGDVIYSGHSNWYQSSDGNLYFYRWIDRTRQSYRFRVDPVPHVRKGKWHRNNRFWKGHRSQRWSYEDYVFDEEDRQAITACQVASISRSFFCRRSIKEFDYWDDVPLFGNRDRSWKHCTRRQSQHKL